MYIHTIYHSLLKLKANSLLINKKKKERKL